MSPDATREPAPTRNLSQLAVAEFFARTAAAANASLSLADAAQAALDEIGTLAGWAAGRVWSVESGTPSTLVSCWVRPDEAAGIDRAMGLPAGPVVRAAAAEGRAGWGDDSGSAALGLGTSLAFPVTLGTGPGTGAGEMKEEVAAVLEFFTDDRRPPDDDLLEVMAGIADLLAQVAEREALVTALRRSEERLRVLTGSAVDAAGHDPLTGLADRATFHARLDLALARAGRGASSVAAPTVVVLWCDLDRFGSVNDSFGHGAGDRVMAAFAHRLARQLPPGATVARMGSDEFAVLVEDVGAEDLGGLCRLIQETFATPFDLDMGELWLTASIGVTVSTGAAEADVVLREASTAMARAKQGGRGRAEVFNEAMRAATWHTVTEHELREAVTGGQLRLRYQPIVELAEGEMIGVEALVRWQHPSQGLLGPAEFIPLAEASRLVVPLGRWVLNEACRQAATWQDASGARRSLMLTVNVAAQQFAETAWVSEVAAALAASELPADRLVLEITESALMDDTSSSRTLEELRGLGLRLAIDDFGTGYSSLAYLRRMPVDFLKIDKAFVDGVTGDAHESALARALVKLASTLGFTAIAEGIERREQAEVLDSLGCLLGQGMWLGPPESGEAITSRLG